LRNLKFTIEEKLILFLPILNAIADVTIYYFSRGSIFHTGDFRGIVLFFLCIYFLVKHYPLTNIGIIIILYSTYLLILTLLSSDVIHSLKGGFIKWFVSFFMFQIGYYYFKDFRFLYTITYSSIIAALFICVNYILAQFVEIGVSAYVEDTFYTGGAGVGVTNSLSFIVLLSPIIFLKKDITRFNRYFIVIIVSISIIIVFITMKRASIFGLAFGFLGYILLIPQKSKIFKFTFLLIAIVLFTFPLYENVLLPRLEKRIERTENYESEGRFLEIKYAFKEFQNADVFQKLFGTEAFNSRQYFGPKYFHNERMIHGDIARYFYGTGLIGLFGYLLIYLMIYFKNIRVHNFSKYCFNPIINACFYAIFICASIITITGFGSVGERSLFFLFAGGLIGYRKKIQLSKA